VLKIWDVLDSLRVVEQDEETCDDIACSNAFGDDMRVDEKHYVFHVSFYHLFSGIAHLFSVEFFFSEARELYSCISFLRFARRESNLIKSQPLF